jgi:hypothetical protein
MSAATRTHEFAVAFQARRDCLLRCSAAADVACACSPGAVVLCAYSPTYRRVAEPTAVSPPISRRVGSVNGPGPDLEVGAAGSVGKDPCRRSRPLAAAFRRGGDCLRVRPRGRCSLCRQRRHAAPAETSAVTPRHAAVDGPVNAPGRDLEVDPGRFWRREERANVSEAPRPSCCGVPPRPTTPAHAAPRPLFFVPARAHRRRT